MPVTVDFERPPVRDVELTVYMDVMVALQVSHLAHVIHSWQEQFPKIDELPPMSPWQESGEVAFLSPRAKWPFPTLWMAEDQGTRSIRIQQDRLILAWHFGDQGDHEPAYPGYLELKDDLRVRFSLLAEAVLEGTGERPNPLRVEVDYRNSVTIDESKVILANIFGLPDASNLGERWPEDATYVGTRIHKHPGDDEQDRSLIYGLDLELDDEDGSSGTLAIISSKSIGSDTDMWDALDDSHDVLIEEFLRLTGPKLQSAWGRK